MPECKWCGRKGMLLRLSKESGLCKTCHQTVIPDVYKRMEAAREALNLLETSKDLDTKIQNCSKIIENAQILVEYEGKRVCNLTPMSAPQLLELAEKTKKKCTLEIQRKARLADEKPICPYCGASLAQPPKRKTKCKKCENHIFVDTKQEIFPRTSLTGNETAIVAWFNKLCSFGITTDDYIQKNRELENSFGSKALPRDVIWALFQNVLKVAALNNNLSTLARIYYEQAQFLYEEGKNHLPALVEFHEITLKNMALEQSKNDILHGVQIATNRDACPTCRKLDGIRLTIEEAAKKGLLPNENCTHKPDPNRKGHFCRCFYKHCTKTFRELGIDIDDIN